jgi:predicted membrane protein
MNPNSSGFLDSLNKFLKIAKDNLLWTSAFGLFVLLFWFLIGFLPNAPNRVIASQRKSIEFQLFMADGEKVKLLYDILQESISTSHEALNHYQSSFAGVSRTQPNNLRAIAEGIRIVTNARRKLSFAIGAIQGVEFYSPSLSEFRKGFEGDLRNIEAVLATVEDFYIAKASGDENAVTQNIEKLKEAFLKNDETMAGLLLRVQSFGERSSSLQLEWQLAVQEDIANLRWFYIQFYFALFAVAYEVGFIIIGIRGWLKNRARGKNSKTATKQKVEMPRESKGKKALARKSTRNNSLKRTRR